ncbi:MAG: M12 family metallo-peptidase [Myxococcota bacterium]
MQKPLQVLELADVALGTGYSSGPLRFTVPAPETNSGIGFSVVVETTHADTCLNLVALSGPDARHVSGVECGTGEEAGVPTTRRSIGGLVATVPGDDKPAGVVKPGEHCVAVTAAPCGAPPDTRVKVRIILSERRPGALSLHVHLPPGLGIPPETAADHPVLKELVSRYFLLLEPAGIFRGDVVYSALDARFSAPGSGAELEALYRQATGRAGEKAALDILLVEAFVGELAGAEGISRLGGPQGLGGAGPAIVWRGRVLDAIVWAHESGHFLGLKHTNEFDGDEHDSLSDTAECTPLVDCQPEDYANIMSPGNIPMDAQFSPAQSQVLALSPLVDPTAAPPPPACQADSDCVAPTVPCAFAACVRGYCLQQWRENGTECDDLDGVECTHGACESGSCVPQGATHDGCFINGECWNAGQTSVDACWRCDPDADPDNWTRVTDCPNAGPRPGGEPTGTLAVLSYRVVSAEGPVAEGGLPRDKALSIYVLARNNGDVALTPWVTLTTADPAIQLLSDGAPFAQMAERSSRESLRPVSFAVRNGVSCDKASARMTLLVEADGVEPARRRFNVPLSPCTKASADGASDDDGADGPDSLASCQSFTVGSGIPVVALLLMGVPRNRARRRVRPRFVRAREV